MVRTLKIEPLPSLFRVISDCDCSQNDHKISENPRLPTSYVLMASVNENEGISKCHVKFINPLNSLLSFLTIAIELWCLKVKLIRCIYLF